MPKHNHNNKRKKSQKTATSSNKISKHNHHHHDNSKTLQIKTKIKSIKSIEFDEELMRLKEREAGATGRNKVKKSLATNIVIQGPTLQINDKAQSLSIVDLLLMNEESDILQTKAMDNTLKSKSNSSSNNMYAVLDEDYSKPTITIQQSILKLGNHHTALHDDESDPDI